MARGDKSAYTPKQQRMAEHIEEGYEQRGLPENEAERRAWATVNKETGGGRATKQGRKAANERVESREHMSAARSQHEIRSEAAKKGWATRKRNAGRPQ